MAAVAADEVPVPPQYKEQPRYDFRHFPDETRGFKVGVTKWGKTGTKRKLAGPAAAPVVRNVPVPPDADDQLACPVCGDQFEQFLDDDTDEWMYRGAVEVDGAILHQQCHEPPPLE